MIELANKMRKSPLFGGDNRCSIDFDDTQKLSGLSLPIGIYIRKGYIIDKIAFIYDDGARLEHGGNGGGEYQFSIDKGDSIVKIEGNFENFSGSNIQNIAFHTKSGKVLRAGTPAGNNYFEYTAQNGFAIFALYGRARNYLDNIGFYEIAESMIGKDCGGGIFEKLNVFK